MPTHKIMEKNKLYSQSQKNTRSNQWPSLETSNNIRIHVVFQMQIVKHTHRVYQK